MSISKMEPFYLFSDGRLPISTPKTIDEIEVLYDQNTIDPQDIREEQTETFAIFLLWNISKIISFTTTDFGVEGTLSW